VLLFLMGLLRLGALVRYVPVTIVIGFTNGIAVLIAFSQLRDAFGLHIPGKLPADFFAQLGTLWQHAPSWNPWALLLTALCFAGLWLWPRLSSRALPLPDELLRASAVRNVTRIPAPIVALISLTLLATLLEMPVETIGTRFGSIPSHLPAPRWPQLDWAAAKQVAGDAAEAGADGLDRHLQQRGQQREADERDDGRGNARHIAHGAGAQ
jgi:SulP family sulfate permease